MKRKQHKYSIVNLILIFFLPRNSFINKQSQIDHSFITISEAELDSWNPIEQIHQKYKKHKKFIKTYI